MLFGRNKRSRTGQELRDARPRAPHQLLDQLTAEAGPARRGRNGYRSAGARLAVLGIAVVALAAVGGIGFAASTAFNTTKVKVQKVSAGSAKSVSVRQAVAVKNAASAQYTDTSPVVTKPGAPVVDVVQKKDANGEVIPIKAAAKKGDTDITLNAELTVEESGTLSIQVLGADGNPVTIDCLRTQVRGGDAGTAEATICRVNVNGVGKISVRAIVPARNLKGGESLTLRLGYTDKDASQKRTIVDIPAEAPAKLPTVTRTFKLTADDVADIRNALDDGGKFGVTFRAFVTGESPTISIAWAGRTTSTKSIGPVRYAKQSAVDRDAVVTVTGGEITGGDFKITDYFCESGVPHLISRSRYDMRGTVTFEPGCAGSTATLRVVPVDPESTANSFVKTVTIKSDNTVEWNAENELTRNTMYRITVGRTGSPAGVLEYSTLR